MKFQKVYCGTAWQKNYYHAHKNRKGNKANYHPVPLERELVLHSLTNTGKVKCVTIKNTATNKITWLSKYETKEQHGDKQCYGSDSGAVARSPWRRQCGCRGNAEGCWPQLPEEDLYARCTQSDCPPRSPPLHTEVETDICIVINSNTGGETKWG